ncbi:BTAD domain-containing putative transcriptional regulator [Streptomyces sp. NRRL F-5123]|uniref:BTAD domain-containing putative transcriptional regulator n=1 Tax=Streptomyces sp. NRRL F-5123 TaxID=1463856 RepID=UPI0006937936|nr:BTAD domain-containing putative transcriptional regulator [Streptomyces sp. NRRL F-5123]
MRYFVLGVTEARQRDGAPVALGGGRVRALAAALALSAGRPVPTDTLIEYVWAADPPADATGALQALVARLRKALGRDAVTSEPGGYRLAAEPDAVDLFVFERLVHEAEEALAASDPRLASEVLARGLALWRGPALADLPERAVPAARPEALRRTAQRLRVDAELALGRAADVLPELREAVLAYPLDEVFRVQLISALRATGRTADALVAYEEARETLADVLGADPGPELRALHADLLRQGEEPAPGSTRRPPEAPDRPRPAGNLRARLTSFVGRETDLRDLDADIAHARLVTLTGPGGTGKTRLAQEAAEAAAAGFPDGVWLAELAPLDDPAAIPYAVLNALGRRDAHVLGAGPMRPEPHGEDPVARLLEHCASRRLLLVLDNCEHLIAAAATLTAELLAACPAVTVLATSREPLGVPGEVVRPVEPLPLPTAHRLFAERAAAVRPAAAPYANGAAADGSAADDEAVTEICRRLDGLPLAIELAAARLRALTPQQIAQRLDDRFRLLTSGSRTVLPRQQTLRAVVDWSWDLLTDGERAALCALSVFAGGCTLAAAEAVCGPDALETVAQLVDKSLVVADLRPSGSGGDATGDGPHVRYRLLETIHEYAVERAAERPAGLERAARAHTAYYRDLARTADDRLRGADQLRWLEVLEAELDNIRAALHRAIEAGDEPDALAIVLAMGWFWWLRNYRDEADGWLGRALALSEDAPEDTTHPLYWPRTDALMTLFFVKSDQGSEAQFATPQWLALAERLERAYRHGGPHAARFPGIVWPFTAYVVHGGKEVLLGGTPEIRRNTSAVVANCRAYGGDWELATALLLHTHMAVDSPGGLPAADAARAELAELTGRLADRWILAQAHGAAGEIAMARGDYRAARADLEEAQRLGTELGAFAESAFLLARMAEIAYRDGDHEEAHRLLARADDAAERYTVWDARTYVRYLGGMLRLWEGDVPGARRMCELAAGHVGDGTPPPVFHALLASLSARITTAEGRPRAALAELDQALRLALAAGPTELVVGSLLDIAAEALSAAGDAYSAARLLSAADAVRGPLPRSAPERESAAAVAARTAEALPPERLEEARERGAALDPHAAADLITALTVAPAGPADPADLAGE